MTYPLTISPSTHRFSLKSVAQSIVQQDLVVVSVDGAARLNVSAFEVYAHLGEKMLQTLFNSAQDTTISDEIFAALCSSWSKSPQVVDIVSSVISKEAVSTQNSRESLLVALKTWRDGSESRRTFSSLRQILDPLSMFAGRNPLELAELQLEDLFSSVKQSETEPNTIGGLTVEQPERETGVDDSQLAIRISGEDVSDRISGFAGSSSLELAGVQSKECSGDLLPTLKQSETYSTTTGGLTVKKLKRETGIDDSQLATMIRQEDINKIAGLFDEVETYLDKLGLLPAQQTDVKDIAYRHSTTQAMTKALKLWRQPDPYAATFQALVEILLDLRRGDVAVRVCQYITEEIPKHK